MAKITLSDLTTDVGSAAVHNSNNDAISAAFENTLSRDGTLPNEMEANLDMNDNCILNVGCIGMGDNGEATGGSIYNVTEIVFDDDTIFNSSTVFFTPSYENFTAFYNTTEGTQFYEETVIDVINNNVEEITWGVNNVTSATYEFVSTDRNKLVTFNNGGSGTAVTIPQGTFGIGTRIDVASLETGAVTFAGAVGVTVNGNPGLALRSQYCGGTLVCIDTDTWLLMGDLTNA